MGLLCCIIECFCYNLKSIKTMTCIKRLMQYHEYNNLRCFSLKSLSGQFAIFRQMIILSGHEHFRDKFLRSVFFRIIYEMNKDNYEKLICT